ncbi:hypothetical protein IQ241_15680 [Romeria aff. gracilis LEGE 07310]|uniref:Uncharacterized protein n=1 Tax=Vasconcelosia minhoensis LEGE 07310 TaxID=915328 RepID=A0A8J7AJG5_9CYAN|nr:ATP synthase F0 subunit B [Romeria gracilis]MBE9078718.1 hypothetical protein [Romeria aff. gracilis LEGE 07310]
MNNELYDDTAASGAASERFNLPQELDRVEEILLDSPRLPLTGRTLVSEDEVLDQLDIVRVNLPSAFQEATQIVQQRDAILTEAEQYAQEIVTRAEKQAATILNELTIIRQAEQQAQQIRLQTEQECESLRSRTVAEIEQFQNQSRQEWEEAQRKALSDRQAIKEDADTYADQILEGMERQFIEMLHVLRNGRQQIQTGQAVDVDAGSRSVARPNGSESPSGAPRPARSREVASPAPRSPKSQRPPRPRP